MSEGAPATRRGFDLARAGLTSLVVVVAQASFGHATVILLYGSCVIVVGCERISVQIIVVVRASVGGGWGERGGERVRRFHNALFSMVAVATEAGLLCPPANTAGRAMRAGDLEQSDGDVRRPSRSPAGVPVCSSLVATARCILWPLGRRKGGSAGRRRGPKQAAHARIFAGGWEVADSTAAREGAVYDMASNAVR